MSTNECSGSEVQIFLAKCSADHHAKGNMTGAARNHHIEREEEDSRIDSQRGRVQKKEKRSNA